MARVSWSHLKERKPHWPQFIQFQLMFDMDWIAVDRDWFFRWSQKKDLDMPGKPRSSFSGEWLRSSGSNDMISVEVTCRFIEFYGILIGAYG